MYKSRYEQIKEENARINLDNYKDLVEDNLEELIEIVEKYVIEEIINERLKQKFQDRTISDNFEEIEYLFDEDEDDDEPINKITRLIELLITIDAFEQVLLEIINDFMNKTLIWVDINTNYRIQPYLKAFDSLRAINIMIVDFFNAISSFEVDYKLLYLVLVELENSKN